MIPSSMYIPKDELFHPFIQWRRVYITERTGKIGEPCGVPRSRSLSSERALLNLSQTLLSLRKDSVQPWISDGKLRSLIMLVRCTWLMLSKKP